MAICRSHATSPGPRPRPVQGPLCGGPWTLGPGTAVAPGSTCTHTREGPMTLHVDSEVGRLRQAILHRPDLELKRLTPTNHDEYLFDDVLWVKHAKQEHDAFAEVLRDQGVAVHLLDELLTETVAIPEARQYILE